MIGYIKLYRQLFENPDYFKTRFDEIRAWIDLLLLANYEDKTIRVGRVEMNVERGQVARSVQFLAERWRWSKTTVQKFLVELEKRGQIRMPKKFPTLLISIVNYEKYQGESQETIPPSVPPLVPPSVPPKKEKVSPLLLFNPPLKESGLTGKEGEEEEKSKNKFLDQKKSEDAPDKPKTSRRYVDKRPPKTESMEIRKEWFRNDIRRVSRENGKYTNDMCNAFYIYWSELTVDGKLMWFEKQPKWETSKRLATWAYNNENKWNNK